MIKQFIRAFSTCVLSIVLTTGCQKGTYEELVTTSGEAETSTYVVEVETTIGESEATKKYYLPIEEKKEELAQIYDSERINIKEWTYLSNGWIPGVVEMDGIEYTYGWNEKGCLTTITGITGSDGTNIKVDFLPGDDCYLQECKNGRNVKYIKKESDKPGIPYEKIGFEYQGKIYTYVYDNYNRIRDIEDEDGNIVATYKYDNLEKGTSIEVINYTDDNIGDVNSLKYDGYYVDDATGFSFLPGTVVNVINFEDVDMTDTIDPMK